MWNKNEIFIASTDTVVGIGAIVSEENRLKINTLKKSNLEKKLIIMVSSIQMAIKYFSQDGFDDKAKILAQKNWPGSVTLVCNENLALRMPKNNLLLKLIDNIGPIYMTSANLSGQKPLTLEEAQNIFKDIKIVYDFGLGSNKPSKIIDVKTNKVVRS